MLEIVQIPKKIYVDLIKINKNSSVEECGIFLGEINKDIIKIAKIVLDNMEKNKKKRSTIRYTKGIYQKYQKYINQDDSIDYIGEWHTHPNGLSFPSLLDNRAMKGLLNHPLYTYPDRLILGIISPIDLKIFLYKLKQKKVDELKIEIIGNDI